MRLPSCLAFARSTFRQYWGRFVLITLALLGVELLLSWLLVEAIEPWGAPAVLVLFHPLWGGCVALALGAKEGHRPTLTAALRPVYTRPLQFLGVAVSSYAGGLAVGVGVFVTAPLFMFAPISLLQGKGLFSALEASARLVCARPGQALSTYLALVALNCAAAFSFGLGAAITLPLSALILVHVQASGEHELWPLEPQGQPLDQGRGAVARARRTHEPSITMQSWPARRPAQRGATLVEYLVLIGLVSLGAVSAIRAYGRTLSSVLEAQGRAIQRLSTEGDSASPRGPILGRPPGIDAAAGNGPRETADDDDPQALSLISAFGGAAWDDVSGAFGLAGDLLKDPLGTLSGGWSTAKDLGNYIKEDPWGATKTIATSVVWDEESGQAWQSGNYGKAIGRTLWNGGSLLIPGAGAATKLAKLPKLARTAERVENTVDRVTPGKGEGVAPKRGERGDGPTCTGPACTGPDGKCFVAGTPVDTDAGSIPIEQVRLGDRVGPPSALCEATAFESWTRVQLRLLSDTGTDEVDLELLRPNSWLEQTGLKEGSSTTLALEELALVGTGFVLRVEPGPSVAEGERCPATALIRHSSAQVISVRLDAGAPLELTSEHRLFSASRNDWVAADDLDVGEQLQTRAGALAVTEIDRAPRPPQAVFNLEVFDQHEYFVGEHGVRAHNDYAEEAPRGRVDVSSLGVVEGNGVARGHAAPAQSSLGSAPAVRAPPAELIATQGRRAREALRRGRGPTELTRIDAPDPRYPHTQWEAHVGGRGSPALRGDGTWKHVGPGERPPNLSRETLDWLRAHGWNI